MRVDEVLAGRRAPMPEEHVLDVRGSQRFAQQRVVAEVDLAHRQVVGRAPVGVHLLQNVVAGRSGWLVHECVSSGCCRHSRVRPAITDSSSVRMTYTATRLESPEIRGAPAALRAASNSMPRNSRPPQTRGRMGAEFSPIPPANTRVSRPPSAAVKAPIHFFVW